MSLSYFETRMRALGLQPGEEMAELPDANHKGKTQRVPIFSENEQGDVVIHYHQLSGAPYQYRREGNKWAESYKRTRLKEPLGDMKYSSPREQGMHPFMTPEVIWKHHRGEKIHQLTFVEGEFKGFAAARIGADAVGMGSIHGFYAKRGHEDDDHQLHPDIATLIRDCKVETVVLLFDADALTVRWKHEKDLYTRQHSFRKAAANFYKVMEYMLDSADYALKSVVLGVIKSKFSDDAKGFDDLVAKRPREKGAILSDLRSLNPVPEQTKYFDFLRLDQNYWTELEEFFGLLSVDSFYKRYGAHIGKKQFIYRNARYVCTNDGEVRFLFHRDVENFFRIGTDWMKKIQVPNKFGDVDEKVIPFSISEINRDYPSKSFPGFVEKVKKYDAYCNEPNWTDAYKREHYGCYNLSNPIVHKPHTGTCPVTLAFLKHIFSGEGEVREYYADDKRRVLLWRIECVALGDQFTVGIDWLSIFYHYPKQMLPVPILVSKEFGTGKSTFFKWLKAIYGSNVAILNNEQFKMRFNAHYITKALIIIDEGFLDVDKKAEKERLKQLVTSDTAYVEHKGVNLQEFPYFGKVLMGSNDADTVMKLDSDENRWFVVKVPKLDVKKRDPDLEKKMAMEIPAFLHFLSQRTIAHPREERLWFKEQYFITDQFRAIVKATKTRIEKNIDDLIKDMFLTYKVSALRLSRKWIVDRLNESSKYKTDQQEVKKYLDDTLGMKLHAPMAVCYPLRMEQDEITGDGTYKLVMSDKRVERYYEFKVEEWITEDDFQGNTEDQRQFTLSLTPEPVAETLPF